MADTSVSLQQQRLLFPGLDACIRFSAAAASSAVAEVSTLPVDIAKVRLQTQHTKVGGVHEYRNMIHAGFKISQKEGPLALWKGLTPALMRQCSYTGLSFVLYEPIRNAIAGENVRMEDISFVRRVIAGGMAGGISIFLVNPTDVIKTRMQTTTTSGNTISKLASEIYRLNGVRGFWAGWSPNVARSFIGVAAELGCYDYFKSILIKHSSKEEGQAGPTIHLSASFGAGGVSAIFSAPVDVVRTRLMSQAGHNSNHRGSSLKPYTSVGNAFVRIVREEGVRALYKGFGPLALRKVMWTMIYFMTYEHVLADMYNVAGFHSDDTT